MEMQSFLTFSVTFCTILIAGTLAVLEYLERSTVVGGSRGGSAVSGALPGEGYKFYTADNTLYITKHGASFRAYLLDGPIPDGIRFHQDRHGMYLNNFRTAADAELYCENNLSGFMYDVEPDGEEDGEDDGYAL